MIISLPARVNLTSGQQELLKWIAVLTMTVDHASSLIIENAYGRILGRIAFPLFAYLLAYNLVHHRVPKQRLLLPMLVGGLISVPITYFVWDHLFPLNIFFTLSLGIGYTWLFEWFGKRVGVAYAMFLTVVFGFIPSIFVEYMLTGPLVVFAFFLLLKYEATLISSIKSIGVVALYAVSLMLTNYFTYPALAALGVLFLLAIVPNMNIKVRRLPSKFYYVYYPVHLLVLALLGAFLTPQP